MNTREKVLKEALNCVNGEREKQYGNPEDNFKRIADLWSDYLSMLFEDVVFELDPIDVAKMMVLFKIARSNGDKDKMDNYVDIIGYAACAAEIFDGQEKDDILQKRVEVADECKECDYSEKCAGTGVCLKEEEEKWFDGCGAKEDKLDEKCNRNDCWQFDACMAAYQHYIYNKTKEASEAIDKCMCENGKAIKQGTYSYFHDKLANYASVKAKEEHVPLETLKDIDHKFPRKLEELLDLASTDCVINGKKLIDCYKEIDELFAKYKPEIAESKVAESRSCSKKALDNIRDFFERVAPGTVTNKEEFEKRNRDTCGQFDAYIAAWQTYKDVYIPFWQTHNNISAHIALESSKANVNPIDVADNLTRNGHALMEMASLLQAGKLNFDDVASYVDDAINEVKKETKNADNN